MSTTIIMGKGNKILFVDDERQFSAMTKEYLESKGHKVTLKHSGDEGIVSFKNDDFELCILDIKMPLKDGFVLATEIRDFNEFVPIIFLTGQTEREDRIKGLSLGADDYITKPFSMEELNLRIQNIMRRITIEERNQKVQEKYTIGNYKFDATVRELKNAKETIKLTAKEAKLLQMFCKNMNGVVERDLALKRIWGDEYMLKGRSLNVYVSKLRHYLKEDPNIEFLNVHGYGYKMAVKDLN